MRPRPKSCLVCGRRVESGASRCDLHKVGSCRKRPCLVCGRPSQGNYCEAHDFDLDEAERTARNPYRKHYKSAEYARNRRHRFERAHGRCENCRTELLRAEWECDHVVPLKLGGSNDLDNLRVLCKPCHRVKTREDRKRKD